MIILKTSVETRKSAQPLVAPRKPMKALFTNQVTTSFMNFLCTTRGYTSFSRSTEAFRIINNSLKKYLIVLSSLLLASCGDFPEYDYDQSHDYCVMTFPFAGGVIGRQYIGFIRIISSLQYLDENPSVKVIVTGPSHIDLEPGSVQKIIIDDKVFKPEFNAQHVEAELQLWGPTFIFNEAQSTEIYHLLQQGNDLKILGRLEVGHQYETDIYNFFFGSADEPFRGCINRLLDEEDIIALEKTKLNNKS